MINNLELFEFCLKNAEPIIDENYIKKVDLIISKKGDQPTSLMRKNSELQEVVSAFSFAYKNQIEVAQEKALEVLMTILEEEDINYCEFVSFWSVMDISYSNFVYLNSSNKKQVLQKILKEYIRSRHDLYLYHGYSATTLQAGKDAKAHKKNGSLGAQKIKSILDRFEFANANLFPVQDFIKSTRNLYLECDKKGKKVFLEIIRNQKIAFSWSKNFQGKLPDFLLKIGEDIFVLEHKNSNESGGGQNKQISELISFIEETESSKSFHYISFLDGSYFNLLNTSNGQENKLSKQAKNIRSNLEKNPKNYFVNTAGFKKLIQSFA